MAGYALGMLQSRRNGAICLAAACAFGERYGFSARNALPEYLLPSESCETPDSQLDALTRAVLIPHSPVRQLKR